MLEHYMFPWGNKRKLQWSLAKAKALIKAQDGALRYLEYHNYELQEELHGVHIHRLQPLAEESANMSDIEAYIRDDIFMDGQAFYVTTLVPDFRMREEVAMDYTDRAIYEVAHKLALMLTERIAYKLKEVFAKLKGV